MKRILSLLAVALPLVVGAVTAHAQSHDRSMNVEYHRPPGRGPGYGAPGYPPGYGQGPGYGGGASVICSEAFACGARVGIGREIDARSYDIAELNANAACQVVTGNPYSRAAFSTTSHGIQCGRNYGLGQWNGSYFAQNELPICGQGWVTVINQITCY
ncbi:MAG: hypothetical protein H7328_03480 [Bdellovibrio sp.]|nr:hypothetical protein [Bdellovibrio sp.]